MTTIRRLAFAMALAITLPAALSAQMPGRPVVGGIYHEERHPVAITDANWRVGLGVGPSISTNADLIADFRAQERLYARRQFNDLVQAEVGVGIHRMAGNDNTDTEFDTHFWSLDARALIAPALNDQWNPYAFAGIGYSLYRIIDPADQSIVTGEGVPSVAEEGGGVILPLGLGVQFKPSRQSRFALDAGLGYSMVFNEEMDGAAGGGNQAFINGLVALEYLFHDVAERPAIVGAGQ